jgi:hypothetical protein
LSRACAELCIEFRRAWSSGIFFEGEAAYADLKN